MSDKAETATGEENRQRPSPSLSAPVGSVETKTERGPNSDAKENSTHSSHREESVPERPKPLPEVLVHQVPKSYNYPFGACEFHLEDFDPLIERMMTQVLKPGTTKTSFFPFVNKYEV